LFYGFGTTNYKLGDATMKSLDLVFSDIHADIGALDAILDMATSEEFTKKYGAFSRVINLGDLLERGTHPKQVLQKMKSLENNYPVISVNGNHDEGFLYNIKVSDISFESLDAHAKLTENDLEFFKKNSDNTYGQHEFVDTKNGLFCVHGGPLDPNKITPKNAGDESWLYKRVWQRLTSEDFEFFSYSGYHYRPKSAFDEAKKQVQNHIILCGHQHQETVIEQDGQINEIYSRLELKKEKVNGKILERREIKINQSNNYIIRLGLGGPEGYYGKGKTVPHFGIVQYDPKKVILFTVNP
jgi:predicted phosphodiesterase